jgi:hypothetical protein
MRHYIAHEDITYRSPRYGKTVTVPKGYVSDGATKAVDLCYDCFMVHDWLCGGNDYWSNGPESPVGEWDDGTAVTNWQASHVYTDLLKAHGIGPRRFVRFWATFLFGGQRIKQKNGWW